MIQTHHPNHPLLGLLVRQGYREFAEAALQERRQAELPPFSFQALLRAEAPAQELPQAFLSRALELGRTLAAGVELLGPAPAPMERRAGRYRAQLLVQAQRRSALHGFLERWVGQLAQIRASKKVRWSLDVDPLDLL